MAKKFTGVHLKNWREKTGWNTFNASRWLGLTVEEYEALEAGTGHAHAHLENCIVAHVQCGHDVTHLVALRAPVKAEPVALKPEPKRRVKKTA